MDNDQLYGGDDHDSLVGAAGNDLLDGGFGSDGLYGRLGTDQHFGGNAAGDVDLARYDDAVYGNLTIRLDGGANAGTAALGDTYNGIEGILGGSGNDAIVGDGTANFLYGGAGGDRLHGGGGTDFLSGGGGGDWFVFNSQPNTTANADTMTDFVHGLDEIWLARSIFAAIGAGLDATEFALGAAPADGNDYISYDSGTGQLFYDADGSDGVAPTTLFAMVTVGSLLDVNDFVMI